MTTGDNKIEQRMVQDGGIEKELSAGVPIDGYADPTGEYPRRHNWFGNSQSSAGRGVKINELWMGGSVLGANFDIPVATASIYPFNNVNETPSGHSFEMDDTPGNERILIKHHSGAGVELKQDGSVIVSSRSHQIQVVGADHEVVVQGKGNITYDGDLTLTVNGDYNLNVNGNYNVNVGANHNHSINDSYIVETGDTHSTIVRGNKDIKVGGHTSNFYSGDVVASYKTDIRNIVGKDWIINSKRNVRLTAMEDFTTTAAKRISFSSEKYWVSAKMGKVGGDDFHFMGSLFTGPKDDYGSETIFQGSLIGRALEAWTSKYSKYSEEAHSAHISNFAGIASYADFAATSGSALFATGAATAGMITGAVQPPAFQPPMYKNWTIGHVADGSDEMAGPTHPDYQFNWPAISSKITEEEALTTWWPSKWQEEGGGSVYELQKERHKKLSEENGDHKVVSPHYVTDKDWWEAPHKISPYAVRWVEVDPDDAIFNKISKNDTYTYYFSHTPDTFDVRSRLRSLDPIKPSDRKPYLEPQKCIDNLLKENRMSAKWDQAGPSSPYKVKRTGKSVPQAKYGYTLLGNPVERASKSFTPQNKGASSRLILADPNYNPDKHDKPITSGTKLSKSSTMGKFMGAPGSKASLDYVPIIKDRQDLARQYYLHAWLMEGVASAQDFKNHRLQVTEGYYRPIGGIDELATTGAASEQYWREEYDKAGHKGLSGDFVNELRYKGRGVFYTLYNSRGKIDYAATFECSLMIRDTFFYDECSLDYDMTRPDGIMSAQIFIVMPKISPSFRASFEMKTGTYFNRKVFNGSDLVEITD